MEGGYYILVVHTFLESLDGFLHLPGCLDVGKSLQVNESPNFILDKFGLKLLEEGVKLLITENKLIVFIESGTGRRALIGEKIKLFNELEAVAFALSDHSLDQTGEEEGMFVVVLSWGQGLSFHSSINCIFE